MGTALPSCLFMYRFIKIYIRKVCSTEPRFKDDFFLSNEINTACQSNISHHLFYCQDQFCKRIKKEVFL